MTRAGELILPDSARTCSRASTTVVGQLCGRPAWYKFELDASFYPEVKTRTGVIKGFACTDHGKDIWKMKGLMSSQTIV